MMRKMDAEQYAITNSLVNMRHKIRKTKAQGVGKVLVVDQVRASWDAEISDPAVQLKKKKNVFALLLSCASDRLSCASYKNGFCAALEV